jgi:hypothetical protein
MPVLDVQITPDADPRDALDRRADLVVTRDPALVDYAASRPELATFPLPWSRTYVLLQPAGAEMIGGNPYDEALRQSLARDAVHAEARPAEPPFWWTRPDCTLDSASVVVLPKSPVIAYTRGDAVARGLAERIVALAAPGSQLRTAGLDAAEFAGAIRGGRELGYIIGLPSRTLAPCRDSAALPRGSRIQPLIDTRAHAIVRRGSPDLTVDWDGTVRIRDDASGTDHP